MTPRKTDFQERKDQILSIVVEEYVKTVTPVSSGFIAKRYPLDLSPATIRNILSELENEGFLTHPHTSAGRMPTQGGYRYYVDNLMSEIQLLNDEKMRIKSEYQTQVSELGLLLEKTSEVISNVTNYTSIISIDGVDGRIICHGTSRIVEYPEQNNVQRIRDILTALEEKERLLTVLNRNLEKRIHIYIGREMALREMESCSLVVSKYKSESGASGRLAVLGPTRMDYSRVTSALDYFSDLMSEVL